MVRDERGQTAAEYMGMLLLVALIVGAIVSSGVAATIAGGVDRAVCAIAQGACDGGGPGGKTSGAPGGGTRASATVDTDGDGLVDADDPVPTGADVDGDGLTDGEELALGSDALNADSDGDGTPDGEEFEQGTDPTQGIAPLTEENVLAPWERVGMTEDEWRDFEREILDEVNPGGWEGFLLGNPYYGVTLDENGELKLLEVQQMGLSPGPLLRALGAGGRALSASGAAARAAARLPAATRAALIARGVLPGVARIRPPVPPSTAGTVFGELDALGRTTGAAATITRQMLNTGSAASRSIRPAGFVSGEVNHARGHLISRLLGGSGRDPRNLTTLFHRPANTPVMSRFEQQVANAVRGGQTVRYEVVPIYRGSELIPRGVTMRATGDGGFRLHVTVLNRVP
jgi:hypothetical protein